MVTVFFAATGLIYGLRSMHQRNAGDAIITGSALMMALGMPVAMYYFAAGAPADRAGGASPVGGPKIRSRAASSDSSMTMVFW